MIKRPLNWIAISLTLLISACISSETRLPLGHEVKLLPDRSMLVFADIKNDEFYKFTYSDHQYVAIEEGDEDELLPSVFHKIPGLPDGYHVGWMHMGMGSSFEANYYNIVWLEKSKTGRQQLVMFAPGDDNRAAIANEMNADPSDGPKIKNTEEMVRYAQILHKMSGKLRLARLDIYDLSNKTDYAAAEALVGADFLTN